MAVWEKNVTGLLELLLKMFQLSSKRLLQFYNQKVERLRYEMQRLCLSSDTYRSEEYHMESIV